MVGHCNFFYKFIEQNIDIMQTLEQTFQLVQLTFKILNFFIQ